MRAGQLRDRVAFKRAGAGEDALGHPTGAATPLFTVWGNVRETTGKERLAAGTVTSHRVATIRIRNSSQARTLVTETDTAVVRGDTWNIRSIAQADNAGVMLDLLVDTGGVLTDVS